MALTFQNLYENVQRKIGANDTAGSLLTAIKRAINDAYSELIAAHEWPWTQAEGQILTVAPLTEADGGSLTVSGTGNVKLTSGAFDFAAAGVGDGWEIVDDVRRPVASASGTELTLSIGWPDTSPVTTYTLYKVHYSLSSLAVRKVLSVSHYLEGQFEELIYQDPVAMLNRRLLTLDASYPMYWSVVRYTTTGVPMLTIAPPAASAQALAVLYYRYPTYMSQSSDVPIIPERWHYVLEDGALAKLHQDFFHDVPQAARAAAVWRDGIRTMMWESQVSNRAAVRMRAPSENVIWPDRYRDVRQQ